MPPAIKRPVPVDTHNFNQSLNPKYGLPSEVEFCSTCVISNQRPSSSVEFQNKPSSKKNTISIDSSGICDACNVARIKDSTDWTQREEELLSLLDKYRSKDGSYDCLVPGSGGKDSFYQAHVLKYKYGMNPLTCTWAPNIYTDWGYRNHQRWIESGFDNVLFTPNKRTHRLLTRLAVDNLFHPFQPFILGQKNLAPKIAASYGISLIFYGENEAEYGNPKADIKSAKRDEKYFTKSSYDDICLSGFSLAQLEEFGLSYGDIQSYLPIDSEIASKSKIEVHYLGYYLKWHPQRVFYYAVDNCGFETAPSRNCGTYSKYNSLDDKIDDLHYHSTYIKFGIGRATYDASQEIRSGELDRDEAIALVNRFDGEYPERWLEEISEYLSIDKESFPKAHSQFESPIFDREYYDILCDNYRSPHLWFFDHDSGSWVLRQKISPISPSGAHMWQGNTY